MSETYEQLRDEVSGEAGQAWRNADREEGNLLTFYRSLQEDPRYTVEHKAEKAWESYETAKEKIAAGKRRWWIRSVECPVLVDVYDWTDERLIFSVLVWPPLESPPEDAPYAHRERVGEILEAIASGSADRAWSVRWEIDADLRWDADRQVWVGGDGYAYDGTRLFDYSRSGAA